MSVCLDCLLMVISSYAELVVWLRCSLIFNVKIVSVADWNLLVFDLRNMEKNRGGIYFY